MDLMYIYPGEKSKDFNAQFYAIISDEPDFVLIFGTFLSLLSDQFW